MPTHFQPFGGPPATPTPSTVGYHLNQLAPPQNPPMQGNQYPTRALEAFSTSQHTYTNPNQGNPYFCFPTP